MGVGPRGRGSGSRPALPPRIPPISKTAIISSPRARETPIVRRIAALGRSNAAVLRSIDAEGAGGDAKLLAIGDSWFAFPLPLFGGSRNLVDAIAPRRPSVAIDLSLVGDTAANMASGERYGQLRAILAGGRGEAPIPVAAVLISAGGNDLVDRIGDLVDTVTRTARSELAGRATPIEAQREAHRRVLEALAGRDAQRIHEAVIADVGRLAAARDGGPNAAVPAILHGYCHVTPRDAPALRFPFRIGPWIWKVLEPLGYTQAQQQEIARRVIDEHNRRLAALADATQHVHLLDLRTLQDEGSARTGAAPQRGGTLPVADPASLAPTPWWHDEIHLNTSGWELAARRLFDPLLDALLGE
jgi:hypothetical protein